MNPRSAYTRLARAAIGQHSDRVRPRNPCKEPNLVADLDIALGERLPRRRSGLLPSCPRRLTSLLEKVDLGAAERDRVPRTRRPAGLGRDTNTSRKRTMATTRAPKHLAGTLGPSIVGGSAFVTILRQGVVE